MIDRISTTDMRRAQELGTAVPLLPAGVPGPVHHQGRWWAIPTGEPDYTPVTPAQAAQLDEYARRLRIAAAIAQKEDE